MIKYLAIVLYLMPLFNSGAARAGDIKESMVSEAGTDSLPGTFTPVLIRTSSLTISGGGTVIPPIPFTPILIRSSGLTISGGGTVIPPKPFTPITIAAPKLTISGKPVH